MNRRRTLIFTLAAVLAFAVVAAACGSSDGPATTPAPTSAPPATAAPAEADTPAPAPTAAMQAGTPVPTAAAMPIADTGRTGDEKLAPELQDITGWINSEPFTLESQRGKVVLIDIWTYTCINCIRTLPYVKAWHEKYADQGLVVIGVHSPEFEFEKVRENVVEAVEKFGIEYAVAQDNDFGTWRALNNRYWPAKYLVDRDGYIRYNHFGEGAYQETEDKIRELLVEIGADLTGISPDTQPEARVDPASMTGDARVGRTRELYAGYERNYQTLLSQTVPPYVLHEDYYEEPETEVLYTDPGTHENHFMYLQGLWRNDTERLVHVRETEDFEDYVALRFYANSVNAVMAPLDSGPCMVRITLDGEPLSSWNAGTDVMFDDEGNSYVVVDEARMFSLVNKDKFSGHELKLHTNSDEFSLFALTFGSYEGGEPG